MEKSSKKNYYYTYVLGCINHKSGLVDFYEDYYDYPDDALCRIIELSSKKLDIDILYFKKIDFISSKIDAITYSSQNETFIINFERNFLEDFQMVVWKKEISKGYIYNSSQTSKLYTFFLKQIPRREVLHLEDYNIKTEVIENLKQLTLVEELKKKIQLNNLKKVEKISKNTNYDNDFKKELIRKVEKQNEKKNIFIGKVKNLKQC